MDLEDIIAAHAPLSVPSLDRDNLYALDFRLMKVFPAYNILMTALERGSITRTTKIVETSSGTMALGLAIVAKCLGMELTIFGDPAIEPPLKREMEALGARVVIVEADVADGNVQQLRKQALLDFMKANPDSFWTRQYDAVENRLAYAPAAKKVIQRLRRVDMLVVPVGSGGSSSGLTTFLRHANPEMSLVGVDTFNSVLFGQPAGPRALRGLGNSVMPKNVDHALFDEVHWVGAADAFHATHRLQANATLKRGPTSGASYMVAKHYATANADAQVLAVLPDDWSRYSSNVWNPDWMERKGYAAANLAAYPVSVTSPIEAKDGWCRMTWGRRALTDVLANTTAVNEEGARG